MAEYTSNLHLEKPFAEEFYDVEVQNRNMEKIDAVVAEKISREDVAQEIKKAVEDGSLTAGDLGAVSEDMVGAPNGVAGLDENGTVPVAQGGTGATTPQAALAALGAMAADATGADIPVSSSDQTPISASLSNKVSAVFPNITTLDDLLSYRNVFTCVKPPATGMPYFDYWNCIVWADTRESTEEYYTRVVYASPANKNELWKFNVTNGVKSGWVCLSDRTSPQETPLPLSAGASPSTLHGGYKCVFRKDQSNKVYLTLGVQGPFNNGQPIFELPEDCRPDGNVVINAYSSEDRVFIRIDADGIGYVYASNGSIQISALYASGAFYAVR